MSHNEDPKGYYKALNVSTDASIDQIKKSYKTLSKKLHPDKLTNAPLEEKEKSKGLYNQVRDAYEVLSDSEKRATYDAHGDENYVNQMSFFEDMINQHRGRNVQVPQLAVNLTVSLEELVMGTAVKVDVTRQDLCVECDGTGSQDKKMNKCTVCNGNGMVLMTRQIGPGMIQQMQTTCGRCSGRGSTITDKCKKCLGSAIREKKHRLEVSLPCGIRDGSTFHLQDQGHEYKVNDKSDTKSGNKSSRGPIVFSVHFKEHPKYKVIPNSYDVTTALEISLMEALFGFTREIQLLDGTTTKIRCDEQTHNGDLKMIHNGGLPKGKVHGVSYGKLILSFNVKYVPKEFLNVESLKVALGETSYAQLLESSGPSSASDPSGSSCSYSCLENYNESDESKNESDRGPIPGDPSCKTQ